MTTAAATNPALIDGHSATSPPELDVSKLPANGFDWHSPLWWGNLLAIFIETTTIVLLLATYFYIIRNEQSWPPTRSDRAPFIADPVPALTAGTLNLLLLLASVPLVFLVDRWARQKDKVKTRRGLVALATVAALSILLRAYEFPAFHFRWDENAYSAIVWVTLAMHLIYVLTGLGEFVLMGLYIYFHGLDDKHALDVTLAGIFWYWVTGVWVVVYVVLYWVPRWV